MGGVPDGKEARRRRTDCTKNFYGLNYLIQELQGIFDDTALTRSVAVFSNEEVIGGADAFLRWAQNTHDVKDSM